LRFLHFTRNDRFTAEAGETEFFTKRPVAARRFGKKPGFFGLA
jgi:hypothetical protein